MWTDANYDLRLFIYANNQSKWKRFFDPNGRMCRVVKVCTEKTTTYIYDESCVSARSQLRPNWWINKCSFKQVLHHFAPTCWKTVSRTKAFCSLPFVSVVRSTCLGAHVISHLHSFSHLCRWLLTHTKNVQSETWIQKVPVLLMRKQTTEPQPNCYHFTEKPALCKTDQGSETLLCKGTAKAVVLIYKCALFTLSVYLHLWFEYQFMWQTAEVNSSKWTYW